MVADFPNQFVNWMSVEGVKIPCSPYGSRIDAHNPANWISYDQARQSTYGVAFVFTDNDPYFFLDLDKCFDVNTGDWTNEAKAIFGSFPGAWGEVSQSGKGLHIIGKCDKSKLFDRRNKWDGWKEFYVTRRFVAFGQGWSRIAGISDEIDYTDLLLKIVPQRETLGELPDGIDPSYTGPDDDNELIQMMMRSRNMDAAFGEAGVTFSDLWNVNKPKLVARFPHHEGEDRFDHSSADMSLMNQLAFWTGKNMARMDRLFRRSGLMREKYEKREDYRMDTIHNACRIVSNVYSFTKDEKPNAKTSDTVTKSVEPVKTSNALTGETLLTVPEQVEYFDGCVYVRDLHKVLVPDGALLKPDQFNASYGGKRFIIHDNEKPVKAPFEALTQNTLYEFPQAIDTSFNPTRPTGEIIEGRVNVYKDPHVTMRQGDISRFLQFLERLVPDPNDREILINYIAAAVQYPGYKFQWAPVLQGVEGNGKTMVATTVAYALGDQYVHTPRAEHMGEKFNKYLENKLWIIVEEVHMNGRREMLDILKPLVTNRRVEVRGMQTDQRMIDNMTNWFFCTNYQDAILKQKNDRRYAIFYTGQQEVEDLKRDGMDGRFFPDMYDWLRDEGYQFVAHWLKNYEIKDALNPTGMCHRAPKTSATDMAINLSLGVVEQHILEAVEAEMEGFRNGWIATTAVEKLIETKRLARIQPRKLGTILETIGYTKIGRSTRPILRYNGIRPTLYYRADMQTPDVSQFEKCQGWA